MRDPEWGNELNSAFDHLQAEWERLLRARPDSESQASAELLWMSAHPQQDREPALARLRDRSERTRNPNVVGLWAQEECRKPGPSCDEAARLWQEVAPDSIWALSLSAPRADEGSEKLLAFMDLLMNAHDNADPRSQHLMRLWALEPALGPGVRRVALPIGLIGVKAAHVLPAWTRLGPPCRGAKAGSPLSLRCERLAEHLWRSGPHDIVEAGLVLAMARGARPLPEVWKGRARELEALSQWQGEHILRLTAESAEQEARCTGEPSVIVDWARDFVSSGDLKALRRLLAKDKLDELSQSDRRQHRRSLLDPRR